MNYKLVELNENMGQDVYEMYQDIPDGENGQTNKCYGLTFPEYKEFLKKEILRKYNEITDDDTPTLTYILYVDTIPVGLVGLRTKINDKWKLWSGNVYYKIRKSERKKGYGTLILKLAKEEFKKMEYEKIYTNTSSGNIGSEKVIENNGGRYLETIHGSKYYEILLDNIYLKTPTINELHYRQEWMINPKTMEYNAGYDVDLKGYDKNTGTISKTEEEMKEWYFKWTNKEPDKYFAYIYDRNIEEPVGEIYYYLDDNIHSMGILIANKFRGKGYSTKALLELEKIAFEKNNIGELSDIIPVDRIGAINCFLKAGFKKTNLIKEEIKFDKVVNS